MSDKINMSTLTLAQAKAGHYALWDWLAETGGRGQAAWPGWAEYTQVAVNYCFACTIEYWRPYGRRRCSNCPIAWSGGRDCRLTAMGRDGNYKLWANTVDPDTRRALAAQIRDLPWKENAT